MACGLPIVTTPVFGIAEQVRQDVNALFYRAGNYQALSVCLATLVRNDDLRGKLASESPRVLRSLVSYDDMNSQYHGILLAAAASGTLVSARSVDNVKIGGRSVRTDRRLQMAVEPRITPPSRSDRRRGERHGSANSWRSAGF
jgi:hypothetical protein